jgi:serine/threonine protein kinase/Tol biopolymer transport system component
MRDPALAMQKSSFPRLIYRSARPVRLGVPLYTLPTKTDALGLMTIDPGTRLGPHEVLSAIGAGGMGEVYRARDTRLDRIVAIKTLPDHLSHRADLRERFEREARAIASLNHPHICTVFDVGHQGSTYYLVMEYLEGQTLTQRLRKGPLPLPQALQYACQVSDALDKAHRRGITHRDLKPANVMLTKSGAKLLDFGLAKLQSQSSVSDATLSALPNDITGEGTIIGTMQYMAPEQLEARDVDARTDIFAFGAVLYEMVTGKKAFEARSQASLIAKILEFDPPPVSSLQPITPPALDRIIKLCLAKDPDERWQNAADLARELQWISESSSQQMSGASVSLTNDVAPRRLHSHLAWLIVGVLLGALGGATLLKFWRGPTPAVPLLTRTSIMLPSGQRLTSDDADYPMAISPDGRRIAYVAEDDTGSAQLYLRELGELEPKAIAGTSGARHPFFSPDGKWIAFFAEGALQRASVAGGAPLRICNFIGASMGGSWSSNNIIVFASRGSGLFKVEAAGGAAQPLDGTGSATWPEILPDDKTVLFSSGQIIATIPINGGPSRVLAQTNDASSQGPAVLGTGYVLEARLVQPGFLVYGQSPGVVRAIPVDPRSLALKGPPISIVDRIERASAGGAVYFAVSSTGTLLYAPTGQRHQIVWVDRNGVETPLAAPSGPYRAPRISPDGKWIAVAMSDEVRRSDIWIYNSEGGARRRFTSELHNLGPTWSPDGTRLAFGDSHNVVEMPFVGSGAKQVLTTGERLRYPCSYTSDGQTLLFQQVENAGLSLWRVSRNLPGAIPTLLMPSVSGDCGLLSPNDKWLAYVSTESGRAEIYVSNYPGLSEKIAVSTDGGQRPLWSRNGRELFFRHGDALMAVPVETRANFRAGKPHRLFSGAYRGESQESAFDVAPDGQRFVMIKSDQAAGLRQFNVVQNWLDELKQRATSNPN